MTKLKWSRESVNSTLNSEYWSDPINGFDKGWHHNQETRRKGKNNRLLKEIDLGIHKSHQWAAIKCESGPHSGKLICITCNNKFIRWLPKDSFI
jgi:hypothetical protein